MRRILIRSAILIVAFAALLLLWIFAGRSFSLLLDRFGTAKMESRSVDHVVYDGNESGGVLEIAGFPLSTQGPDGRPFPLSLRTNTQQQLVLSLGGKFFELDPKSGETVSLSIRRSLLSWPTPFDFNFMTGHSPSWKRNLYYVLDWRKASGHRLEMVWRYEQYFYPGDAWASGFMTREGATGLIRVKISP
jgi:hypothetical protein